MFETASTAEVIARALDVCALRQAVYSANIANANVEGYRRLEVMLDAEARNGVANAVGDSHGAKPAVVATDTAVKLDEEMSALARNALRYQTLLDAYERSASLLKMAVREGKE